MRFKLPPSGWKRMCDYIKERDRALWAAYWECMGEYPPVEGGEVHHVLERGKGGPDCAENLILLSENTHQWKVHKGSAEISETTRRGISEYMEREEVKAWNERHAARLAEIYLTAQKHRERKLKRQRELHCKWGPMPRRK